MVAPTAKNLIMFIDIIATAAQHRFVNIVVNMKSYINILGRKGR
jgi:hypothetical protein